MFHITDLIGKEYVKGSIYVTADGQKTLIFKVKKGELFPKIKPQ